LFHHPRHRTRTIALAASLALTAAGARAQVLQIEDDGAVRQIGAGWRTEPPPSTPPAGRPYAAAIDAAARTYDLSPDLLDAVARSESGYDAKIVSPAGAIGVMQLMPATARGLGVDPWDPAQNIMGGAAHLRAQLDRFDGAIDLALAAYNAGGGRVVQYRGVPPFRETQAYVATNLDRLAKRSLAAPTPAPTGDTP
jgi:soluble lytic murein transglycosylase-like protein